MEEYKIIESSPSHKKVMDITEFRAEYGLGKQSAYNLAHRADAPIIKNGKKFLFIRSRVDAWMESLIGKQI
ncbi:helix-turn-helix domain-containing protein [Clostridium tyrobutyricum]|jgi:hypothetical protein|uniref:helix-turn-helix domain-containing protein n=1 Tax=Clostridium tyrobutyricum TaxID=1519 RepID=UPI001C37F8ED|nr:helix-turn-helix domain-containing protein [Clostridium tyrobutyricum]MBV4429043.1 helix-turn-helix domain-containing protein [Clostridium tyrobutyricum]MBV4444120.1 helix-turn-helix domain-containing protein [Clostridium tyrobutyricum]